VRASRASVIAVLSTVGFVLVGVWGAVNLSEGDWFIGVVMVASAIVGLWSLAVRVVQERRRPPRGPVPPGNKAVG
jgi:tellurite resistance protein TehA-like permease